MHDFLPFIIIGITTGSVYGLAATGLVLTYKTSGIFNFAYGSIAAISIYVFYWLHVQRHWAWPMAALICLAVLGPIQGLLLERLARVLDPLGSDVQVVATVGIILLVIGIGTLWYGNNVNLVPNYLPTSGFRVAGVTVSWGQVIVTAIAVTLTATLYALFRYVRLGIAMRGVVDNPVLVSLTGESPARVRRWAWLIGSVFAALAGLLLAPELSLDGLSITMLVVQAFGAAAIGYFANLPLAFVGGLIVGIAGAMATKYVVTVPSLSGLPPSLPFAILFVVLIVTPKARLVQRRVVPATRVRRSYFAPPRVRGVVFAVVLILLAAMPMMVGAKLSVWTDFLIEVVLVTSLGMLVRLSGQLSLCQLAFAGIGAAAFSHFANAGAPWLVAVAGAAAIAIPVGAFLAIPAIRLSGVFLALATLGFGIFLENMLYTNHIMFGPASNGIPAPRPHVSVGGWHLYTDTGFYYVALIFCVIAVAVSLIVRRARLGRLLAALADSPLALEAGGTNSSVTRVVIFCISAAMASIAGALLAMLFHFSVGSNYQSFNSLILVAVLIITTAGDPWYAILASLGIVIIPGYVNVSNISTYMEMIFGAFAINFAFQAQHLPSVPRQLQALLDRLGGRVPPKAAPAMEVVEVRSPAPTPAASPTDTEVQPDAATTPLEVSEVSVRYGGVLAVDRLSLSVPTGSITGLVGPNGAGKTTTFNAISGLVRVSSGAITIHSRDVSHLGPAGRAQLGLGRTFQRTQLFDSLTVAENIALGQEAHLAGANPFRQLSGTKQDRARIDEHVQAAVGLVGVEHLLGTQAGLLTLGQRRLVELARTLAGGFDILLLDEPSSGLDASQAEAFGKVLTRVARQGTAILLVEHNMTLVSDVCRKVYVMDFGRLIFQGAAAEMARNPLVRSAYLGETAAFDELTPLEAEAHR